MRAPLDGTPVPEPRKLMDVRYGVKSGGAGVRSVMSVSRVCVWDMCVIGVCLRARVLECVCVAE